MPSKANIVGPLGHQYADPTPSAAENAFQVNNTSAAYYSSPYYLAHKSQVQPIPPARRGVPAYIELTDYLPKPIVDAIDSAGEITFHAVGDTGAAKVLKGQTPADSLGHEAGVADAMAADVLSGGLHGPAFFFHLGDIIRYYDD